MQWHKSGLIASWVFFKDYVGGRNGPIDQFMKEPVVEKHCQRNWGVMVVIKSLQLLLNVIGVTLKEAAHQSSSLEPVSHGGMLHVALVGMNNQMTLSRQDR